MADREHVYRVTEVVRIVDGDTYWLRLDVGFRQSILANIRLAGYDTPEKNRGSDFERVQAKRAQQVAVDFFAGPGLFMVQTKPDPDDFGRWLGSVWSASTNEDLGAWLAAMDLATVWPERWHDRYDPEGRR